jgi:hypothetical protein
MTQPAHASQDQDDNRFYNFPDDDRSYPSITTIISGGIPKELAAWAARETAVRAVDEFDTWALLATRKDQLEYVKTAATDLRDHASTVGTIVHAYAEARLLGRIPTPAGLGLDAAPEAKDWFPGVDQWIEDWMPEVVAVEATVISTTHGYAGTTDLIAWLTFPDGRRRLSIVDFKSGARMYSSCRYQLAAGAHADVMWADGRRVPVPKVEALIGVHFNPKLERGHESREYVAEGAFEIFLHAKEVFEQERTANRDDGVVIRPPGVVLTGKTVSQLRPVEFEAVDVMVRVADRCRRLQDDGHLQALIDVWPAGVPTPKAAEASGYDYTATERIALQEAVTAAERTAYAADPGLVAEMVTRLRGLAPDLFAQVVVNARRLGVPNLTSPMVTCHDLDAVLPLLDVAERAGTDRWHLLTAEFENHGDLDMQLAWFTERTDPAPAWGTLTAMELELALAVLSAVTDSYLTVTVDGELEVSIEQEFVIVDRWSGKKQLVEAAKAAADRHELKRPSSTAKALADPLIVALIINGPKTKETEHDD